MALKPTNELARKGYRRLALEVKEMIFQHVHDAGDTETLRAGALICEDSLQAAVRIIWEKVSWWKVLSTCLPASPGCETPRIAFGQPDLNYDRFVKLYARHVRVLTVDFTQFRAPFGCKEYSHPDDLLSSMSRLDTVHIKFDFQHDPCWNKRALCYIDAFLKPTLKHLSLDFRGMKGCHGMFVYELFFCTLYYSVPNLETLQIDGLAPFCKIRREEDFLSSIAKFDSLKILRLPYYMLNGKLLAAVSKTIPNLVSVETIDGLDGISLNLISKDLDWFMQCWDDSDEVTWPPPPTKPLNVSGAESDERHHLLAMRSLELCTRLSSFLPIFTHNIGNLQHLHVVVPEVSTVSVGDVRSLASNLGMRCPDLRSFRIMSYFAQDFKGLSETHAPLTLTWPMLQGIKECRKLEEFTTEWHTYTQFTMEELDEALSSWPHLRIFQLCSNYNVGVHTPDIEPTLTLEAVELMAKYCPLLQTISIFSSLAFDPTSTSPPTVDQYDPSLKFKHMDYLLIHVGLSPRIIHAEDLDWTTLALFFKNKILSPDGERRFDCVAGKKSSWIRDDDGNHPWAFHAYGVRTCMDAMWRELKGLEDMGYFMTADV